MRHWILLIIDEVGVQFGSAAEMAILQEIINARYESDILPTILISNLLTGRVVGVHQSPDCRQDHRRGRNWLSFNWPSYRSRIGGVAA